MYCRNETCMKCKHGILVYARKMTQQMNTKCLKGVNTRDNGYCKSFEKKETIE